MPKLCWRCSPCKYTELSRENFEKKPPKPRKPRNLEAVKVQKGRPVIQDPGHELDTFFAFQRRYSNEPQELYRLAETYVHLAVDRRWKETENRKVKPKISGVIGELLPRHSECVPGITMIRRMGETELKSAHQKNV